MKTIILILLTLKLSAQLDDKTKHVYAGFAIQMISSEIMQQCKVKTWKVLVFSNLLADLAGAGKELIYDKAMHRGTPDVWDFTSTCWGGLIGVVVSVPLIDIRNKLKDKPKKSIEL